MPLERAVGRKVTESVLSGTREGLDADVGNDLGHRE